MAAEANAMPVQPSTTYGSDSTDVSSAPVLVGARVHCSLLTLVWMPQTPEHNNVGLEAHLWLRVRFLVDSGPWLWRDASG